MLLMLNPFLSNGLVRLYHLDESDCSFRVSGKYFHLYLLCIKIKTVLHLANLANGGANPA